MNITRFTLLIAALIVAACGMQKSVQNEHEVKASTSKIAKDQAHRQKLSMQAMAAPFLYLAAQDALKEGRHALAIELLSALIKKDPSAIEPHIQLTELLLQSGQMDKAETHISMLLGADAKKPDTLTIKQQQQLQIARIRLLSAKGETDTALREINYFLEKHPTHLIAHDIQSRILVSQKRYDEALAALAKAIASKELPEFRLLQAQLLIKKNDVLGAKVSLMRMQKLAPDNDTPILLLSSMALKAGDTEQAESLLRQFLGNHPNAFRITHALGKLLVHDKREVEAILLYRDAVSRSGNAPNILQALAILYFQHDDYAEAEVIFRQLIDVRESNINRFYLAASLEALERGDEAKEIYQSIQPDSSMGIEAQLRLAAIEIKNDHFESAAKRLKNILKNSPKHLAAHLMLSAIRLTQQRYQDLLDESELLLILPHLPVQMLFNRSVALEHFKRYEQVEVMLNRLLKIKPNHSEALNFLGYTYAIQGIKLDQAIILIRRALIQKPDDGYYLDSLAWAYYQQGDYAKAVSVQAKALQQVSDDSIMQDHYGDMLWRHGDQDAARQAWKESLQLKPEQPRRIKQKISAGLGDRK